MSNVNVRENTMRNIDAFGWFVIAAMLTGFALWGAAVYVAWHFIEKFW